MGCLDVVYMFISTVTRISHCIAICIAHYDKTVLRLLYYKGGCNTSQYTSLEICHVIDRIHWV